MIGANPDAAIFSFNCRLKFAIDTKIIRRRMRNGKTGTDRENEGNTYSL